MDQRPYQFEDQIRETIWRHIIRDDRFSMRLCEVPYIGISPDLTPGASSNWQASYGAVAVSEDLAAFLADAVRRAQEQVLLTRPPYGLSCCPVM